MATTWTGALVVVAALGLTTLAGRLDRARGIHPLSRPARTATAH